MFHADLHIHSKFSRACSKDCDIDHLAWWARRKGITVVGTGDFTHPAWAAELRESLVPAEPGLLQLRPDLARRLEQTSAPACSGPVRFMLSTEISTIYRGGDRTRKVHHLIYAPTFEAADQITLALAKIGNLASDGRPILGLDSRHLLEITLAGGPGCYLVPAHVWTPWFAVLGSKSGFDLVADCYGDLASEIFAIETGLSSDPAMNWRCSSLDGYRLVSNSDAHSPPMLGREATTLSCDLDYFAIAGAFRTGEGLAGTIEFFPEEGKYHLDGHRTCGVRLDPADSDARDGRCPECGKPLTIGVLHRVAELADRPAAYRPPGAPGFTNLVQLRQIVAEIAGVGPASKRVTTEVSRLVGALGPELGILADIPLPDVRRAGGELLAEALDRLRRSAVTREAGFDGEYGTVRLFAPSELAAGPALFDLPAPPELPARSPKPVSVPAPAPASEVEADDAPPELDSEQRAAVEGASPLMIVAGPGTGKTRTLTYRIAAQLAARKLSPESCLAVTFTRRAADEMRTRLAAMDRPGLSRVTVTTFHGLGLIILRQFAPEAGLPPDFEVADDAARLAVALELTGSPAAARALAAATEPAPRAELAAALGARGLVDFDGLVQRPAALLADQPGIAAALRARWPLISVDEYQDIDPAQYQLLRLLAGDGAGLTAIGDPDQAIYGFRGGDVGFFLRFGQDFPGGTSLQLSTNYRSGRPVVAAAMAAIASATLVPGRRLEAVRPGPQVIVHEAADEQAEAAWIGQTVDQLLGGASFHSLDTGRASGKGEGSGGLGLADIAVLYRTDAQSGAIGQALDRAGLPFRKGSHDLLQRRTGVAGLIAELRRDPGEAGPVTARLTAATRRLAALTSGPAAVDLRSGAELLAPLARRCGDDLDEFLTQVSTDAVVDALDPRADAITLLTLHAAKGLEFEVVFLAGCENGLMPLRFPGPAGLDGTRPGPDIGEERRLLFVGLTRARTSLFLSYAVARSTRPATIRPGLASFLRDLGPELLSVPAVPRPRRPRPHQLRLL